MRLNISPVVPVAVVCLSLCCPRNECHAQMDFEHPPVRYMEVAPQGAIAKLQEGLNAGQQKLEYDPQKGYLPAVLKALGIPASSQTLVFSKTSLQLHRITPRRPRAIYFNDDTYIGWVQGGEVLEVSTVDPQLGTVFYTLSQHETESPAFVRDQGQCLTCHASSRTQGVPGSLVRSVFVNASGQPEFGSGTFDTTDTSPFEKRWGGWYVSGTHGEMRHMGNLILRNGGRPEDLDRDAGANVTDLSTLVNVSPYLQPTSDIVALMVLEHQTHLHNLLTLANFETRFALHYNEVMNEALNRPEGHLSESTQRRIATVGDKLLSGLLFTGEFQLTSPVQGVSTFAADFQSQGPKDPQGRSLRDLDLNRRLFKYPCSFLICSSSFDALPEEVRDYVARRLMNVLSGEDQSEEFSHLSAADRQAIREILQGVKPELFLPARRDEVSTGGK